MPTTPAIPRIDWGVAFANQWILSGPLDDPVPSNRQDDAFIEADSGYRDAWERTPRYTLKFSIRFIPNSVYNAVDGAQDAIRYMFINGGRLYPDKDDLLTYHDFYILEPPRVERDGKGAYYRVDLVIQDAGGNPFRSY